MFGFERLTFDPNIMGGFEYRLQRLYRRFEAGEISLGYFANELGLGVRDLYAALEQQGLPTSNIGAKPPMTNG